MDTPDHPSISVTHPVPPPRRAPWLLIALGAALLVLIAGGAAFAVSLRSSGQRAAALAPASPSPVVPTTAAVPSPVTATTPAGLPADTQKACDLNDALDPSADLRGLKATVNQIDSLAGGSSDLGVRMSGHMLKDRYDLAVAAKGTSNEFSSSMNFLTSHIQLGTACVQAGWHASR